MKGKWIWYPDDFEIELSAVFMEKRYERDVFIPPFWKQYSCWRNVKFVKEVNLANPELIHISAEGNYNLEIDQRYVYNCQGEAIIPAGKHRIVVSVYNAKGLPALKVDGETLATNESWQVTCNNHVFKQAAFNDVLIYGENTPNNVKLLTKKTTPISVYKKDGKTVYDFGKEIFVFLQLVGVITNKQNVTVFYGESELEALSSDTCELISELTVTKGKAETDMQALFNESKVGGGVDEKKENS